MFQILLFSLFLGFQDPAPQEKILKLRTALQESDGKTAVKLADELIKSSPNTASLYFDRARAYILLNLPEKSVEDLNKTEKLSTKENASLYSVRGGEYFKLGKIKESIADFDKEILLNPRSEEDHWRRGISLYYADRFEDGAKQFELGKRVYGNDVENAFWHFLCLARQTTPEKARKELLNVKNDSRYYMPKVYEMIAGKAKPEEVLEEVKKSSEKDKTEGYFYANLYVGLYYEATGEKAKGLEYIRKAKDDYVIGHYMYQVAKVHVLLRDKK
ncbi:hypothetical protein KIH39_13175 [Telmatocola sphagniphila]|uniref:Tetratricopeptide repeat protein n=1 Tax=Telmatocola sphagniphila TaxID=1123043 RepID=A0A8E6B3F1_9BACT|nr:hypothetical protein [Telmatocola sphagniphila]QVL29823.1 hypothetical protein KIH39_13175 [Telmatocola sphagniphila]